MLFLSDTMPKGLKIQRIACLLLSGLFVAALQGTVCLPVAQAQAGKPEGLYYRSWAIIIGIERYMLAPPVPGAIEDARRVARSFRELGFDEVIEIYDEDASSRRLNQILNDMLPRKVGRMDRLVIFYSGHAGSTRDMEGKDRGHLVPRDAQVGNVEKSVTVEHLKEFTRRSASKHTLLILDVPLIGWETTPPQQLSLEGRLEPEAEMERRAVQVICAAGKGEFSARTDGKSLFVQTLLTGLQGEADLDKNGWLMASELGAYLTRHVEVDTKGAQHPVSLRIDGEGDTVLIEGEKAAFVSGLGRQTPEERRQAAKRFYQRAFVLIQERRQASEALEHLDRAIQHDATLGDAYVLKGYVLLELIPNLDKALAAAELGVEYAANNPDSFYVLGLIHEQREDFAEAEAALQRALIVKPDYPDVHFSLGVLYADRLRNQPKSIEAFRRYLELGGTDDRARAAVTQADSGRKARP